jgi:hypothetical protein
MKCRIDTEPGRKMSERTCENNINTVPPDRRMTKSGWSSRLCCSDHAVVL